MPLCVIVGFLPFLSRESSHSNFAQVLPRDPFLYPYSFSLAVNAYINTSAPSHHHHQTFTSPHGSVYITTNTNSVASTSNTPLTGAVLTRELVEAINTAYEAKLKAENRKVRRVIKNKLVPGVDSDGAGDTDLRDQRRHTLSMTLNHESSSNVDRSPSHSQSGVANSTTSPSSMGIGSSGGGQILSGIGSLASGLGLTTVGGQGSGDGDSGAGALMVPTLDLAAFVAFATAGGISRRERKRRERRKDSQDIGAAGGTAVAHAYERERDSVVAATLKALWSGRVTDVIRMREDAEGVGINERSKDKWKRDKLRAHSGVASDGDDSLKDRKYEGRSTEEESDIVNHGAAGSVPSFGGMWGGRVRGKLGSWAG